MGPRCAENRQPATASRIRRTSRARARSSPRGTRVVSDSSRGARTRPPRSTSNARLTRPAIGRPSSQPASWSVSSAIRPASARTGSAPRTNGRGWTNQPWITSRPSRGSCVPVTVRTPCGIRGSNTVSRPSSGAIRRIRAACSTARTDAKSCQKSRTSSRSEHGLAAAKPPAAPPRQREHERPRAVRQVAVQLLATALDVERQPGRRDVVAPQVLAAPRDEPVVEPRVERPREVGPRRRAERRVLVRDVPVVPHEAVGAGLARLGEPGIEHRAQRADLRREPVDDDDAARHRPVIPEPASPDVPEGARPPGHPRKCKHRRDGGAGG